MPHPARGHSTVASMDVGCLLIADISGYTDYLMGTELDHAENVLADLMEQVVDGLRPAFELSKLEGDAAFAYAVTDRIEASMLLDTVDACYFAFRSRLRDVDRATTCDCNACVRIPDLDLKLVVHHGEFARREVAGSEELTGRDVVIVHRLLKNDIPEVFDIRGYAFLTDDCAEAMGVDPEPLGYEPHTETYDDVGDVDGYVGDLDQRWRDEQERRRVYVLPDEAAFEASRTFPAPPELLWEYLTDPVKRSQWFAEKVETVSGGQRRGAGTVNHCVHGGDVAIETILDWRPFRYFTSGYTFPVIGDWHWTVELEPVDEGTRVEIRPHGFRGFRALLMPLVRPVVLKRFEAGFDRLSDLLDEELGRGQTPSPVAQPVSGT